MKLSTKFFFAAYITVLLSLGIGGTIILNNVTQTLFDNRIEKVDSATNYAIDSFYTLTDVSYEEISESKKASIINHIKSISKKDVSDVAIYSSETKNDKYANLKTNEIASDFESIDGRLILHSVAKLKANDKIYYLSLISDFTEIRSQCAQFRNIYALVVLVVSAISGIILLYIANRATKPINRLALMADEIAAGNYGRTLKIKTRDKEIKNLSESFNTMSLTLEQKIKEIEDEAQKRELFVADFTHELKTPMTSIIGYSQMLSSYSLKEQEKEQAANAIFNEAKRLERLSLQLLELYVLKNERPQLSPTDLSRIEKELNLTLKFLSQKYNVAFEVDLPKTFVCANRELLISLICNLADNAFKASSPNGIVKILGKEEGDFIELFVEDNGKGIRKENIPLLTEPFFREDKARSRSLGGAGLGLSLCREIAELHKTKLHIESEEGKGTTVSIKLEKAGDNNE